MRHLYACLVFVLALVVAPTVRATPTVAEQAKAYAAENNLPIREVSVTVPGREGVKRIFVPVTDATHDAFVKAFTETGAIIRQSQGDVEHAGVALAPNDVMYYTALNGERTACSLQIVVGFTSQFSSLLRERLLQGDLANGRSRQRGWAVVGLHVLLANGCVAPQMPLSHKLGVKRSTAPSNMVKKAIHAGNEAVVIGIPISDHNVAAQPQRAQIDGHEGMVQNLENEIRSSLRRRQSSQGVRGASPPVPRGHREVGCVDPRARAPTSHCGRFARSARRAQESSRRSSKPNTWRRSTSVSSRSMMSSRRCLRPSQRARPSAIRG